MDPKLPPFPKLSYTTLSGKERQSHPCTQNRSPFPVWSLCWMANGKVIVGGGGGTKGMGVPSGLIVCDVTPELTLRPIATLDTDDQVVSHITVNPRFNEINCSIGDRSFAFSVVDDTNRSLIPRHAMKTDLHPKEPAQCVSRYSADGQLLATGGEEGMVRIWRRNGGAPRTIKTAYPSPVSSIDFSPDGSQVISCSDQGKAVNVFNAKTGEHVMDLTLKGLSGPVIFRFCRYINPLQPVLLIVYNESIRGPGCVSLWEPNAADPFKVARISAAPLVNGEVNKKGTLLTLASNEAGVFVVDTRTLRVVSRAAHVHELPITGIAFSPDDRYIITGAPDSRIKFFKIQTPPNACANFLRLLLSIALALFVALVAYSLRPL